MVYKCDGCGRTFKNKKDYRKHLNRKTPCVNNGEKFDCAFCYLTYSSQHALDKHNKTCTEESHTSTECTYCNKTYATIFSLQKHQLESCKVKKEHDMKEANDISVLKIKLLQEQLKSAEKNKKEKDKLHVEVEMLKKQKKQNNPNETIDNLINSSFNNLENLMNSFKKNKKKLNNLQQYYESLLEQKEILKNKLLE